MKKRRSSLRLVMERGPADGLEVYILAPMEVKINAPPELTVEPLASKRGVKYALDRREGRRAIYRPRESESGTVDA